jgi:uncharacterized membrane protein YgcG
MPRPQPVARLKSGMAERYEVIIDFSKYQAGQRVVMQNVSPDNNIDFETTGVVMAFDVVGDASDLSNNEVPLDLNPAEGTMALTEADALRTRQFEFKRDGGSWTINGTTWDDVINSGFTKVLANPGFGDAEIWELKNSSGGWFHPVHVHLVDFKILDRNGQPPFDYERGAKDVVYVGEGETVRVLMRFEHETGRYMMHCHNLVHEDHDMMAQFLVGEDTPGQDPINADRATHTPARPLRDRHDDPDEDQGGAGGGGDSSGPGRGGDGGGGGDGGSGSGGGRNSGSSGATPSSVAKCAPKKKAVVKKKPKRRIVKKQRAPAAKARAAAAASKKRAACATPAKPKPKAPAKRKSASSKGKRAPAKSTPKRRRG